MRFLEAWLALAPAEWLRLLGPALALLVPLILPGRTLLALAAIAMAVAVAPNLGPPRPVALAAGWSGLWLMTAWVVAHRTGGTPRLRAAAFEAAAVGFALGGGVLLLLIIAVVAESYPPPAAQAASSAIAVLVLGLLHLLLRRHIARAAVGLAALGYAVQLLEDAARAAELPGGDPAPAAVLVATALAVALTARIAESRRRAIDSAWVADAHDLHD